MNTKINFLITKAKSSKCILIVILLFAAFFIYTNSYIERRYTVTSKHKDISYVNRTRSKYILIWTNQKLLPLNRIGAGNSTFVKGHCDYTNCFVTDNKDYFIDHRKFDAVVFGGWDAMKLKPFQLPSARSPRQKYIFAASESPDNFPICSPMYNNFFNWTWTYKIDSNIFWGYFNIFDINNNFIGPSLNMKWLDKLNPIDEELKVKLMKKSKAAAWVVSHCKTNGGREVFVEKLQMKLKQYRMNVDIYGKCGNLTCPRGKTKSCFKKLEEDYYFYLSFENSFADDYVTEKLVSALNNYAIPIVYGSADYSRFLPPGSFLDALKLGPKGLARRMNEIINDKSMYYDFFRWKNHYKYIFTEPLDEVCKLCKMLNNEKKMAEVTIWKDFRTWWNGESLKDKC